MKPRPSRLVAAKAKDPLHPQGTDPMLLIRHVPHRLEPKPQRLPRPLENRPRGRRCLAIASTASKLAPGRRPCHRRPAARTAETIRPANTPKIVRTGGLGREPLIKFLERAWVVCPANRTCCLLHHPNILLLREPSGYPILTKCSCGRGTPQFNSFYLSKELDKSIGCIGESQPSYWTDTTRGRATPIHGGAARHCK